jgi:hypothetical protein
VRTSCFTSQPFYGGVVQIREWSSRGRLDVGKAVSGNDTLSSNTSDGNHGQSSVEQFGILLLLHLGVILGSHQGPAKVTGSAFALGRGHGGGCRNDEIPESNPQEQLVHGTGLEESVVCVNGLGNGGEGVGFPGDADKVGGDKADDGEHGGTSVAEFTLAEPGQEWFVRFRQLERIELEFLGGKVDRSRHVVDGGGRGDGRGDPAFLRRERQGR